MDGCLSAIMEMFMSIPSNGTPAANLTEREKMALCVAAGVPVETVLEGDAMKLRTTVPCGVADRGDGGYLVYVKASPEDAKRIRDAKDNGWIVMEDSYQEGEHGRSRREAAGSFVPGRQGVVQGVGAVSEPEPGAG